ncbi:ABC transporter substrate-binding protein [Paenibacillus ginsengarvi]|nr:ABC transporter substrate-binding protein [Paenibacillus ginsengarvi]
MPKQATTKTALASALVLSLLAGCGGKGNGPNGTDEAGASSNPGKPETATSGPAEVVFYSNSGLAPEQFNTRYGNKLREKFPNYTIKYIQQVGAGTRIAEMVTAKTPFDIYFANVGSFENEALQYGVQSDMTELAKTHKLDLNRFDPSVISGVKSSSNGLYALPIHTDTMVLYYNKDIFDKFGVEYPKNGMTWDDMYALSKRLTRKDGDTPYIGYAPFPTYMFYMNPLSIPVMDEKNERPTINKDSRWRTFFQKLLIEPTEMPEVRAYLDNLKKNKSHIVNAFMKDRTTGMITYVSALAPTWPNEMGAFNWDWVSAPTLKEQPGVGSQPYTFYFGITNMASNKDAAMEVLKYMVSDEFQLSLAKMGYLPVVQSQDVKRALGQETAFKDKNWQAMFYNKMAPVPVKGIYENRVVGVYNGFAEQAMLGTLDVNTALRQAEESTVVKLDEWKR